jgi:hypothetical protein
MKEDILKEMYSRNFTELVPATIFNGEVYTLSGEEFEKLSKHMSVNSSEYNIIKIGNSVFVKGDNIINQMNDVCSELENLSQKISELREFVTESDKTNEIFNEIKNIDNSNGDLNELGNRIGQVVGKYLSDEFGFEEDDFVSGIEHGISVSNGTHK